MAEWQTPIRLVLAICIAATVAGCSDRGLINITKGRQGPDEFAILPYKPIEMPRSFSELPPPTPNQPNRADRNPEAEAVAALGGNPSRVTPTGAPPPDTGLVRYAGRYGTDPTIRQELAAADVEYRRRNRGRVLERLLGVTTYYNAYEPLSLDQHRELERMRSAGARTPGAPPPGGEPTR